MLAMNALFFRGLLAFTCTLFMFVHQSLSLGSCVPYSFSICWLKKNSASPDSSQLSIRLNGTEVASVGKPGKYASVTFLRSGAHSLTLQRGDAERTWLFSVAARSNVIELKGEEPPSNSSLDISHAFSDQGFSCGSNAVFLYQDEDFMLLVGKTLPLRLKMESVSSSMLLMSWRTEGIPAPTGSLHNVSLFHQEMGDYVIERTDVTASQQYRFSGLEGCSPYLVCVEIAGWHSVICLSTLTDPEIPRNFHVTSWSSSSSLTVAWDCPWNNKFSFFLLTVLFLNGTNHVVDEKFHRKEQEPFTFTLENVPPCSRVQFAIRTVCGLGAEARRSKTVMIDGNSAHSEIENLHQFHGGPDNYTLIWSIKNTSSIAFFRVYHEGRMHGSTFSTTHTVGNLEPCHRHMARVEAVCSESVVMSVKTLQTYTGPQGVVNLRYRPEASTALWSRRSGPGTVFSYKLSYRNGSLVHKGRLQQPVLPLIDLVQGLSYILQVWEACLGLWSQSPAVLHFSKENGSLDLSTPDYDLECNLSSSLAVVVPWMLPEDFKDPKAAVRLTLEKIVKTKLEDLLRLFLHPLKVDILELADFGQNGTKISFQTLDASVANAMDPFPSAELLDFLQILQPANITIKDNYLFWDDHDECAIPELNRCPKNSLCINTLDSYICVCKAGYYDVSPFFTHSMTCYEKGTFSHCLNKFIVGGVAKNFLVEYFGGNVTVVLNNGRCPVAESKTLYYFNVSSYPSHCGTRKRVNWTHIELSNNLTVTTTQKQIITRQDLRIVLKCIFPRIYLRKALAPVDQDWISSHTVVEYNASQILEVSMSLYGDDSFMYNYTSPPALTPDDILFFEVALQSQNSFTSGLILDVVSCWATESPDPQDATKGIFLRDGCPIDMTFQWLLGNGVGPKSRFALQMFHMPLALPFYVHCLTRICSPDEDCTTECPAKLYSKVRRDLRNTPSAVVSAGPLFIGASTDAVKIQRQEHVVLASVLGGIFGLLVFTISVVIAIKTMTAG